MHYSTRPKFAQFRKFVKPEVKKYVFIAFERIACKEGLTQTQLAKKKAFPLEMLEIGNQEKASRV